MKKLMKKLNFAIIGVMASVSSSMAAASGAHEALCKLAEEFGYIFSIIQTLAFVGAGITIAGWAWGYISKPDDIKMDDVKKKGVSLLVGFVLLFSIGTFLTIITSAAGLNGMGCDILATGW